MHTSSCFASPKMSLVAAPDLNHAAECTTAWRPRSLGKITPLPLDRCGRWEEVQLWIGRAHSCSLQDVVAGIALFLVLPKTDVDLVPAPDRWSGSY